MKPQHFHLACAALLAVVAIVALVTDRVELGCFFSLGASVALLYWKATKSGLVDR